VMVVGKQKSSTPSTIIDFDKKILVRAGSIPHGPIIKKLQKAK
jgi:tRNA A37 threonylcarbamoyladenosine synthetase subunit TsaC/SUA5/YrdC